MEDRIRELLRTLTVEEKIALTVGSSFWKSTGVDRVGIPEINLNDGPHGVRKPESDKEVGLSNAMRRRVFLRLPLWLRRGIRISSAKSARRWARNRSPWMYRCFWGRAST